MSAVDVDLDALAPLPKRVRLGGRVFKLPGDMPMGLFLRIQNYEQRIEKGEDESVLLTDLRDELLALFQVHQPTLKALPEIGVVGLMGALGAIYGGGPPPGEAAPPTGGTSRQRKKTPSKPKAKAK